MSQENVEIVRRMYAAFAARDWKALADLCQPDVEYETLESTPGLSSSYCGVHEITEFFDAWSELYAEFRVEAEDVVAAGDRVVTVERQAARGLKGSEAGAWVHQSFACLITCEDGKVRRIKEYPSRADALEAAGLSE
jgi:ketosteroid isomerase-like protein